MNIADNQIVVFVVIIPVVDAGLTELCVVIVYEVICKHVTPLFKIFNTEN